MHDSARERTRIQQNKRSFAGVYGLCPPDRNAIKDLADPNFSEWHSRGREFDPPWLHQQELSGSHLKRLASLEAGRFGFAALRAEAACD
jgi:hypothetical protein